MTMKRFLCFFLVIAMMLSTVMPVAAAEPETDPVIIEDENIDIINDDIADEPSEEPTDEPTEEHTCVFVDGVCECGEYEVVVAEVNYVATIGETPYETLAAAIAAANAGDTITLIADVTEDITISKALTIDGAGKTYTGAMTLKADTTIKNVNFDGKGYNGYAITTRGADYLTIEDCTAKNYGYGFVQLASGTALTTVKNVTVSNMNYGVKVDYSNAVVLENVDINAAVAALLNSNYGTKTITIKNSKLSILGTWVRNNTTKSTFVFEGANTVGQFITDAAVDNFVLAEGATLTAPNDITITNAEGKEIVYNNGSYGVVEKTYAAKIGDVNFETLQDAVNACVAGTNTIILLTDCAENVTIKQEEGSNIVIDGAGKTFSGTFTIHGAARYNGAETLTFKKIKFVTSEAGHYFIDSNSTAGAERYAHNVKVESCSFTAVEGSAAVNSAAAVRIRQGFNITLIKNGYNNLHSAFQGYGCAGVVVLGDTVNNCKNGYSFGTSTDVMVESTNIRANGYGLRADGNADSDMTVKSGTIEAELPIVVRKATGAYKLDVVQNVTIDLVANNAEGYQVIFTNGDDGTYEAPTGEFEVTVGKNVSVFPTKAYVAKVGETPYETLAGAIAAANAGDTITLIADVTEDITIGKALTIDGAGKTYTGQMKLTNGANITIKNVNFDGKGYNGYAVETRGADYLTIEDCTAKNYGYGFVQLASGTDRTTVKNVTISNMNYGVKVDYSNAVVLENVDIDAAVAAVLNSNYGTKTITIKDSKLSILGTWTRNNTIKTNIVFEGANTVDAFVIDAAIDVFKLADVDSTLTAPNAVTVTTDAEGYSVVYKDGAYRVAKAEVAKIGKVTYASLPEAVAAAKAGQTVTLLCDAKGPGMVINKDITINFNKFTYTLTEGVGSTGTETNGFQILNGNDVTLRNGTLKVADSAADKFYILVQNYANLSVFNMTLDGTNLDKYAFTDGDSYTLSNNSGKVEIVGKSTITANNDGDKAFAFDACKYANYEEPTVFVATTATINGNIEAAAKVGNTYYATLQAAFDAAENGKTVTLLNDISVDWADAFMTYDDKPILFKVEDKNLTLDMNGKTISVDHQSTADRLYAVIYVEDGAGLIVTGNGSIDVKTDAVNPKVAYMFWKRGTTGYLNIENGNYHMNNSEDSIVYTNGSEIVNVKGGTFTLDAVGTRVNRFPCIFNTYGNNQRNIVVTGGTYNDDINHQYWAHEVNVPATKVVKANGNGTWTVTDAEVYIIETVNEYTRKVGYATFKDAVAAIAKGAPETTIVLNKNITVKGQFIGHSYAQKVVIDLNGFKMSSTDKALTVYRAGTEVTVKNGTVHGNTTGGTIQVTYGGKLTLGENVTVTSGGSANAIKVDANSTLIIAEESVKVQGGKNDLIVAEGAKVEISAGSFKHPVQQAWCAEGYVPTAKRADGTYSVEKDPAYGMIANIGDNYYETLAAAIVEAVDGDEIVVLDDINLADAETVLLDNAYNTYFKVEGKSITIDLNGKTISGAYNGETMLVGVFSTDNNGHLTLTGNGTVNVTSNGQVYSLIANYEPDCTITIENGSFTLDNAIDSLLYTGGNEGIIVKGGTFVLGNVGAGQNGKPWIFNALGANERHAIVTGGSYNADVSNQYWKYEVEIPVGYAVKALENGTFQVFEDPSTVAAVIDEVKYASLADAIEAAQSGETITVMNDIAVDTSAIVRNSGGYATIFNVADKAIIIDLNGKNITATANKADLANEKSGILLGVFAVDNNGSLTLKNGTVTANAVEASMTSADSHLYSLLVAYGAGSNLVVESGNYSANSVNASLVYSQYDEIVTINGGTYTLGNLGTDSNGSPWLFNAKGQNTQNIIVKGGSFSADIQHQYYPFEVQMPMELALSKSDDGIYTVVPAVAYVTEREWSSGWYTNYVGYATLQEAIDACEGAKIKVYYGKEYVSEPEEVVLLKDIVLEQPLVMPTDKPVVLDLNSFTIKDTKGNYIVVDATGLKAAAAAADGKDIVLANPKVELAEAIDVANEREFLMNSASTIEFDGNGNTITTNGIGTAPGANDYGYVGFIPANGADAVVRDVTVAGSGFVEVGHHGVSTGGNYSITNLVIENLKATLSINNGGNNIAAAFSHYGNATMTNCVMTGTTTEKVGYKPYDAAFVNGTKTIIDGGEFGNVYLAHQAHVTITNAEIDVIDSCAITTRNLGKLTIGAGAKIGTINLTPGGYTPNLVIEEGAEVGAIVYKGVTYTVDQWNAR